MSNEVARMNGRVPSREENKQLLAKSAPPQNLEAEQALLGSLLRWNDAITDVAPTLPAEAFYAPDHAEIYAAIVEMHGAGRPVDCVTLSEHLSDKRRLKEVGGAPLILQLWNECMTGAAWEHYAGIVKRHWRSRRLIGLASETLRDCYDHADPEEVARRAESEINLILSDGSNRMRTRPVGEIGENVIADIESLRASECSTPGLPTGLIDLDLITGGLQFGESFVIGARPSQGKTALALGIAYHVGRSNTSLFVSIEMSDELLLQRLLSSLAGVNSMRVRQGKISDHEFGLLAQVVAPIRDNKLWIADMPSPTVADIASTARRLKARQGELALVAVDYLQLIGHEQKKLPREERVADNTRRLKSLARELQCNVIVLSQLNREADRGSDNRPRMHQLRESGAIEQDADVIALLHRPEQYEENDRPGEADLIICKQRNGPTGEIRLGFDKNTTTFRNLTTASVSNPNDWTRDQDEF